MVSRKHKCQTLDDLKSNRHLIPRYWGISAFVASWMLLGGFIMLSFTYDSDSQLRPRRGVFYVIVVTQMTCAYSLTAFICFFCRNCLFQMEEIFRPCLESSFLGFLTVPVNFVISRRYTLTTGAFVTVALSLLSSLLYGALLTWSYRRIARLKTSIQYHESYYYNKDGQHLRYYQNFVPNMYPQSLKSPSLPSLRISPLVSAPQHPPRPLTEDDMISQQMATLLKKGDSRPSPEMNQNTFHIEFPDQGEDDDEMDKGPHSRGSDAAHEYIRSDFEHYGGIREARSNELESEWSRWGQGSRCEDNLLSRPAGRGIELTKSPVR